MESAQFSKDQNKRYSGYSFNQDDLVSYIADTWVYDAEEPKINPIIDTSIKLYATGPDFIYDFIDPIKKSNSKNDEDDADKNSSDFLNNAYNDSEYIGSALNDTGYADYTKSPNLSKGANYIQRKKVLLNKVVNPSIANIYKDFDPNSYEYERQLIEATSTSFYLSSFVSPTLYRGTISNKVHGTEDAKITKSSKSVEETEKMPTDSNSLSESASMTPSPKTSSYKSLPSSQETKDSGEKIEPETEEQAKDENKHSIETPELGLDKEKSSQSGEPEKKDSKIPNLEKRGSGIIKTVPNKYNNSDADNVVTHSDLEGKNVVGVRPPHIVAKTKEEYEKNLSKTEPASPNATKPRAEQKTGPVDKASVSESDADDDDQSDTECLANLAKKKKNTKESNESKESVQDLKDKNSGDLAKDDSVESPELENKSKQDNDSGKSENEQQASLGNVSNHSLPIDLVTSDPSKENSKSANNSGLYKSLKARAKSFSVRPHNAIAFAKKKIIPGEKPSNSDSPAKDEPKEKVEKGKEIMIAKKNEIENKQNERGSSLNARPVAVMKMRGSHIAENIEPKAIAVEGKPEYPSSHELQTKKSENFFKKGNIVKRFQTLRKATSNSYLAMKFSKRNKKSDAQLSNPQESVKDDFETPATSIPELFPEIAEEDKRIKQKNQPIKTTLSKKSIADFSKRMKIPTVKHFKSFRGTLPVAN
ncbi:hypothetical protein BB560_002923 [Smittium megazygosporum]|uniref:Uncharacterized protein n=1 Tax=Smittium megazygosporum TaxID=133381 RepID=A0A2T9ZDK1_9FUNG|nr:hypothetical protein BB560_002923 [Smittium megazygosporum]